MIRGWWYRIVSATGAATVTMIAVVLANQRLLQEPLTTYVPFLWRLDPIVLSGPELQLATITTVLIVVGSLIPLFKPRPWRVLDVVGFTQKRIVVAGMAIATLGYFNYSFRLPRPTVALLIGILLIGMPLWFVAIRTQASESSTRALVVGDDHSQIKRILDETDIPVIGYLCPASTYPAASADHPESTPKPVLADGGSQPTGLERLGGLSKVESVFVEEDIDTAILAFRTADRGEFFGTLDLCYKHGVNAKVHREYADDVLTSSGDVETLAGVDVEPWDPQDYVFKRLFDVAFAGFGLLVLAPLVVVIAIAIKLDSRGPVFYTQARTAAYGDTFDVYKFRSMITDAEAETGAKISEEDAGGVDPRVTRVGYVLRKTHMDEIPQLWSILKGDMSVVGPRPERPEIDSDIQMAGTDWSKRWFIKPGLTGVAQINGATGHEPEQKLRYDIKYIREQSFWGDIQIVIRQIWMVVEDTLLVARGHDPEKTQSDD